MGLTDWLAGTAAKEPAGYYEKHKTFYKRGPQEVERLVYPHQREGCERVTKLTARTFIGVSETTHFVNHQP